MTPELAFALMMIVVSFTCAIILDTRAQERHDEMVRLVNLLATFIGEQKSK